MRVNQELTKMHQEVIQNLESIQGALLRMNRSIQAEGVFAMIKEDMNFRRFLTRGKANVTVEWYLVSMAYNILKLHHKIQKAGWERT